MRRRQDGPGLRIIKEPAGFRVAGTPLWIDAHRPRHLCFISHAHADHVSSHECTLANPTTLSLLGIAGHGGATPCNYRSPFFLGDLRLEVLPSGHLPGGSQLLVERGGRRILYTSDIYDQPQRFCEPMAIAACDVLLLDATYGTSEHRFPPRGEAALLLLREVEAALERQETPLVLVEGSLGRAQEILVVLGDAGHRLLASKAICRWNRLYRDLGLNPPDCLPYAGRPDRGTVLVFPMVSRGLEGLGKIKKLCKIACSGQGVDTAICRRLGVDRLVPFVDHADFDGLVKLVEDVQPRRIFTLYGHAATLAEELCRRGFDAEAMIESPQLGLDF